MKIQPSGRVLIEYLRAQGLEDTSAGALRPGDRISKRNSEEGDGHKDGDTGTVAFAMRQIRGDRVVFICWDDWPEEPIATMISKVRRLQ